MNFPEQVRFMYVHTGLRMCLVEIFSCLLQPESTHYYTENAKAIDNKK